MMVIILLKYKFEEKQTRKRPTKELLITYIIPYKIYNHI